MQTVAVIDYGMGNLHSVAKALEHVGAGRVLVSSDAAVIREADRVVFPGVGAIRDCMAEIRRLGFDALVREVSQDRPFLGICVGMQALLERSEENDGVDCIGLFPGQVRFFGKDLHEAGEHLKVPHMGWNQVSQAVEHPLWHEIPDQARFYFVHSYYIEAGNPRQVVGHGHYGVDFAAALAEGSRFAVQFHPEKSHTHGLHLLQNFVAWAGRWSVMARAKSNTPILQLDAAQTQDAVLAIKRFMEDRFELELGSFEAEELLDFFAREFAPYFYNKAILDVQSYLKERFESIESDVWALEKS